jgi:predicted Rossmann fold nucleotide-binding protein DprA/Smf involved in DNA uptake
MTSMGDCTFAVLGLCSRLVTTDGADPLSAKDYWALVDQIGDPSALVGRSAGELVDDGFDDQAAERYAGLLGRAGALALAVEELDQVGVWTTVEGTPEYPERLRSALGPQAPAILHGAGPTGLMSVPTIGVVGSRNVDEDGAEVARSAARLAVANERVLVSGGARGVDQLAMAAALEADGFSVGILAESLLKRLKGSEVRRAIHDERLCLATPYKPDAGFSVATAMGRNKLIYALSDVTLVVASDHDTGGTWAGATEALRRGYGTVAVWDGPGAGDGNAALIERGAHRITGVDELLDVQSQPPLAHDSNDQLTLGL